MNIHKLTTQGRVTIPKELRDGLGWKPGDELRFVQEEDGVKIVRATHRRSGSEVIRRLRRVRWNRSLTTDRLMTTRRGDQE